MKLACVALDTVIVALAAILCLIALTGGTEFMLFSVRVRAHSTGNGVAAALLLVATRYGLRRRAPFLGVAAWTLDDVGVRAASWLADVRDWLSRMSVARQRLAVVALVAFVLATKAINAVSHPGFVQGDGVEIHEMTFNALFGESWPIWDIRSAFYPMVFIYPVQALLTSFGVTSTLVLVIAGRLVVAVSSTISVPLLYFAARQMQGVPVALLAAGFLSFSSLQIAFGSTELPNPVATVFILATFIAILNGTTAGLWFAGVTLGIASALRFSEVVFLLPAMVHATSDRGWGRALLVGGAALAVAGAVQAASDTLYWGSPFHSARAIADFTVVRGLSSSGVEPAWHYVTDLGSWTNAFVALLAIVGTWKGHWRPALWLWLPVALLSMFPHKEPRYLVPVGPYLALLAAIGFWSVATAIAGGASRGRSRGWRPFVAFALLAGLCGSVIRETARFHVRPSDADVLLASEINEAGRVRGLVAEQVWRMGGRLYLRAVQDVHDLPSDSIEPASIARLIAEPELDALVIRRESCDRTACDRAIAGSAFQELVTARSAKSSYRLFIRARSESPDGRR